MKKMFLLSVVTAVFLGSLAFAEDKIMTFNNKQGAIPFNHTKHEAKTCEKCHPPFAKKFDDKVSIAKEGHGMCKACHKETSVAPACKDCHSGDKEKK